MSCIHIKQQMLDVDENSAYTFYTIVPQLSKCPKFEAVRGD